MISAGIGLFRAPLSGALGPVAPPVPEGWEQLFVRKALGADEWEPLQVRIGETFEDVQVRLEDG